MRHFAVLFIFVLSFTGNTAAGTELGKVAPSIEAKLLSGKRFAAANYAGKVLIVNFWAAWCAPCVEEMPALEAYYRKHRSKGLEMIAISIDRPEDLPTVRKFMRPYNIPTALMSDANISGWGKIKRIPLTYVIDRDGVLRHDGLKGEAMVDLPFLEKTVTPLLKKAPPAVKIPTSSMVMETTQYSPR